ncbi:MAG: chemotaxis protein CheZ [Gallionellaceae bacterium]|nr:MAG: chemotaxis protein CheZ [Gallionellaceae bacterium]
MANHADKTQDSEELEALFDSIVEASNVAAPPGPSKEEDKAADKVINKIGQMTRTLHDTLRELGYDKKLENATSSIPDARDRLNYIATLTERAAERVLNATDAAQPVVEKIEIESQRLSREWQKLLDRQLDIGQFKNLVMQTQAFLAEVPKQARVTNAHLTEIMMAQDFHDLTGQVIKKIVEVTQQMEVQLVGLLVENPPSTAHPGSCSGLLNGPVIRAEGRNDVVVNQDQVDELLESLGF